MNTRDVANDYRMSHWAQIITDQKSSGLSVRAYSRNAGFHENRFYYWQKKLRLAALEELSIINDESREMLAPKLTELSLSNNLQMDNRVEVSAGNVSVELLGIKVSATSDYPMSKLTELLRVVSQL